MDSIGGDYNFINLGYIFAFKMIKFYLSKVKYTLKHVCPHCLLIPRYPLFYKCRHITCIPCLENIEDIYLFENFYPCPIWKQCCCIDKIYSYIVKKIKRLNSILLRMFKNTKFICYYAEFKTSYFFKTIHYQEMFEFLNRSIICTLQSCKFINNV